jgi:choline-sulfatase
MVMIRRDRWKFVRMPGDPDQLFDLEADPHELRNLAGDDGRTAEARAFGEEAEARWGFDAIERRVRESQQARLAVFRALTQGRPFPWDFQPARPAAEQYTRNTMDVAERDLQSRFPPPEIA